MAAPVAHAHKMPPLEQMLATRDSICQKWREEFDKNWKAVADRVTDSAQQQLCDKFKAQCMDASCVLPSDKSPVHVSIALDVCYAKANMKQLLGDAAELPPFSEWLAEPTYNEDKQEVSDIAFANKMQHQQRLYTDFFARAMSVVGCKAVAQIKERLSDYAKENPAFCFKAEWHGPSKEADFSSSSISKMPQRNLNLCVDAWIDLFVPTNKKSCRIS